ncbi:transcriptional regulator, LytTR family [Marivirga sericea]|uniref:Transcriptional regulator, LytTR family n=1 Tax=Marivirga sericea TaxID=1028 RepID=A0A1X7L603_9BACT|nr:LytTR family DNA-binding domain-containing protein [Marivirga sericea]SMG49175.1 transcriptional regulator, LytTR family [Marivirga sericea]
MYFSRLISYTSKWYHTFLVGFILATMVVVVLIFLQPFDIYGNEIAYKNIKMIGYGICIVLPILLIHVLEELWFKRTDGKWHVYQELFILILGFLLISITSYIYNVTVVNNHTIESSQVFYWVKDFGLPFIPIFFPFWVYLRFRFSKITLPFFLDKNTKSILIAGNNQNEVIEFLERDFIMAKAQANYVDIYYIKNELLKKKMIRSKFANLKNKIPFAEQVHRSYLVNPSQITQIYGNTRKGHITIKKIEEEVPVSPKYFSAIKKYLQDHS